MKKLLLTFAMSLMIVGLGFAQSKDKKDQKEKTSYETMETTMDKVPSEVVATLTENGVEASSVLKVYKVKKADGKIYKFKVNHEGEQKMFKIDANGKLLKKGVWEDAKDTSAL
ncbi:MAG: hypothetical protein JJU28_19300 [Cyclobacteriaceae bacterium]|nr:hypothetical protein [Cyclobacteriaceae bacterium]